MKAQNYKKKTVKMGKMMIIQLAEWKQERNLVQVKSMQEWRVQNLYLNNNERAELLLDISHIRFTNLSTLTLWYNCIESVEVLPAMQMPNIEHLYLAFNCIRSVKAARKGHWQKLLSFHIHGNYLCDVNTLAQLYFPQINHLEVIIFGMIYRGVHKNKDTCVHSHFMAKLSIPSLFLLGNIGLDGEKMVSQRAVLRVLRQKVANKLIIR